MPNPALTLPAWRCYSCAPVFGAAPSHITFAAPASVQLATLMLARGRLQHSRDAPAVRSVLVKQSCITMHSSSSSQPSKPTPPAAAPPRSSGSTTAEQQGRQAATVSVAPPQQQPGGARSKPARPSPTHFVSVRVSHSPQVCECVCVQAWNWSSSALLPPQS